jgi:hypothetical protein
MTLSVMSGDAVLPLAVWFLTSNDRGVTWQGPVALDALGPDFYDWEPHLTVDGMDHWHVVWRVCPAGTGTTDLDAYYARSKDEAGTTWTTPVRVNTMLGTAGPESPRSLSIAADIDGHAYISYLFSPFLIPERIHVMTTRERPYDGFEELPFFTGAASPSPFREATTFHLPVPDPATANIRVYDAQGRMVRTWPELRLVRGPNPITWDGRASNGLDAAPGVYLWRATVTDGTTGNVHGARGRVVRVGR